MTHICVRKLNIIGSDNGLSPGRRRAIIGTNAWLLIIWPLGTNFSEIYISKFIYFHWFHWRKCILKSRLRNVGHLASVPMCQCGTEGSSKEKKIILFLFIPHPHVFSERWSQVINDAVPYDTAQFFKFLTIDSQFTGCVLWAQSMIYTLPLSLQCWIIYRVELHRVTTASGSRLNIKTVFPWYGDSHVKDHDTVLSSTRGFLYWYTPVKK